MNTRVEIIKLLKQKKWTVTELCKEFGMTRQAIQYHLDGIGSLKLEKLRINGKGKLTYIYWM